MNCGLLIPGFKKELKATEIVPATLNQKIFTNRVCLQDSPAPKRPDSTVQGVGMHVHGHSVCEMLRGKKGKTKHWKLLFTEIKNKMSFSCQK